MSDLRHQLLAHHPPFVAFSSTIDNRTSYRDEVTYLRSIPRETCWP